VRYADDCVPRTHRRKKVRNCVRDGGRSSGAGRQGQASNHRKLRRSKAGVVSVAEKAGLDPSDEEGHRYRLADTFGWSLEDRERAPITLGLGVGRFTATANRLRHGFGKKGSKASTPRHSSEGSLYAISWRVWRRKRASCDGEIWERLTISPIAVGPRDAIPHPPQCPAPTDPKAPSWHNLGGFHFLIDAASPICDRGRPRGVTRAPRSFGRRARFFKKASRSDSFAAHDPAQKLGYQLALIARANARRQPQRPS
jgi:hypothetical protein